MSEAEWAVCEPLLPAPAWLAGRGGRPASWCMRDIVDAIRYLTHNGPVWRALPGDFPPAGTVYWWLDKWQADGSAERMHDDLRERIRAAAGRSPGPSAAIIDSQSVKGSEMIARTRRGYDAGKKINGTKRHVAVDALGLLLTVLVTAASVQDRDAARPLLWNLRKAFPAVKLAWADGGYAGKLVTWARTRLRLRLEIVKRPDDLHTFQVLPRRWVVERTLSWITRHRRTVRDYERLAAHHETYVYWALIIVMTRRLARTPRPAGTAAGGRISRHAALKNGRIPVHRAGHPAVMATNPAAPVPNPVQRGDANVLTGILAILEGVIWAGQLDERTTGKVAERFVREGLLGADYDQRDLRQAINDMNQRIRYAAGEYGTPPSPVPLPP
jgi:transposase